MQTQNFKNHARVVPIFHFVLSAIILTVLVLSIINLFSAGMNLVSVMFVLIAIAFVISFLKIRRFPLAVQDRAIRAEENLRHFTLTGKLLDKGLSINQIVALRFADDTEFVDLAAKALQESMSSKQIKQAIQHWRPDHHRA